MRCACIVQDAVLPSRSNTVCLLLKICPPGINPEFVMECKLIAHPM